MANPFRNPLARILAHRSPITDDTEKPPKKSQAAGGEGREKPPSILVAETTSMEHTRRAREQKGLRALIQVRVHAREHSEVSTQTESPGESLDMAAELERHPLLEGQQFDGIDNNPEDPSLSPEARSKLREIKRKQELDKQLRLEQRLELQMSNRYTPRFNPRPGGP